MQYKLYSLIWKKNTCNTNGSSKIANTTYKIEAGRDKECEFQVKGKEFYLLDL